MSRRKWNDSQLIEAVKSSFAMLHVLEKLGLKVPGSYNTVRKHVKRLQLDTSHFNVDRSKRKPQPNAPLEKILCVDSSFDYGYIKRRVLRAGLLGTICATCGISDWCEKKLVLHMDHINGIKTDNRLENLRLLCPNCHSQTGTYCGRNLKKNQDKFCACGKKIYQESTRCGSCQGKTLRDRGTKIVWPEDNILVAMLRASNTSALARQLGISSNAVKRRLIRRGLWVPLR